MLKHLVYFDANKWLAVEMSMMDELISFQCMEVISDSAKNALDLLFEALIPHQLLLVMGNVLRISIGIYIYPSNMNYSS